MAKHSDERSKLIQLLSENPFISAACRKVGISRQTFYRWMRSDPEFKRKVELATIDGRIQMEEIAEAVITNAMKKGDQSAARYYLGHNSMRYAPKSPVDFVPPEQREQWEKRKKEAVPEELLSEAQTEKIMDAMKRFGILNEDGSPSDEAIKSNPEFYLQIIKENEDRKRRRGGLPG